MTPFIYNVYITSITTQTFSQGLGIITITYKFFITQDTFFHVNSLSDIGIVLLL